LKQLNPNLPKQQQPEKASQERKQFQPLFSDRPSHNQQTNGKKKVTHLSEAEKRKNDELIKKAA
jgi:hypothetical protein